MLPTLLSLSSSTQGLGGGVERESSTPPTCRVLLGSPPPGNPLGPLEPSLPVPAALMISCFGAKLGYLQRLGPCGVTPQCPDVEILICSFHTGRGRAGLWYSQPHGANLKGWAGWAGAQEMKEKGGRDSM